MNDNVASRPASLPGAETPSLWGRLRVTFGPLLVGLLGGALTAGIALTAMPVLFQNVAATYARYPSVERPWLAREFALSSSLVALFVVLGVAGPVFMGLATAWLVRSKDCWGDLSAGVTTALASTLAGYTVCLGLAVTLALVVVPSIRDLTLVGEIAKTPAGANGHPSDVLVRHYPDLEQFPPNDRGNFFFPKIVADQVVGSAYGVWLGIGLALMTCGLYGFCGTLAGGWLLRRGGAWWSIVFPYIELVGSTSVAAGRLMGLVLMGWSGSVIGVAGLLGVTGMVVLAVIYRWHWLLRMNLALVWFLVLRETGLRGGGLWVEVLAAYLAYGALCLLLVRQWLRTSRRTMLADVHVL